MAFDKNKLIAEIAARHGVRLDPDDPAFLIVDLNMMVLEDQAEKLLHTADLTTLSKQVAEMPAAMRKVLEPIVGAMLTASGESRAAITQFVKTQKDEFREFTGDERVMLREAVVSGLEKVAGAALNEAARALKVSAQAHQDAIAADSWRSIKIAGLAALCSLAACAIGLGGGYLMFGQAQAEQAAVGRAVISVWSDLDSKAKGRIEQAAKVQSR